MPFDTWRTRHNDIQRGIVARANEARVEVEAEVFGLFRDIIPAAVMEEGGGLETVRDRMGCVPDLRLGFPVSLSDDLTTIPGVVIQQHSMVTRIFPSLSLKLSEAHALPRDRLQGF